VSLPLGFCLSTVGVAPAALLAAGATLDDAGADSLWLWDHLVSVWRDPRETVLDGPALLGALLVCTRHCQVGPLVMNMTNWHPARLALFGATLARLGAGRFALGIGGGGLAAEQAPFGVDQGDRARRTQRVTEALQLLPALWRGAPVTFDGVVYRFDQAQMAALDHPPPLIVGARRPPLVRIAGQCADGINLAWRDRALLPALFAALDDGLASRQRDRTGFDCSIHAGWPELSAAPQALLEEWARCGFDRASVWLAPPYPLDAAVALLASCATRRPQRHGAPQP
jgi:alkanesulfonate monooxygenase SsuD/methylene tetrahydromethanopterin reductase-like flavin-dependent oxidoreductase (luciferase family)